MSKRAGLGFEGPEAYMLWGIHLKEKEKKEKHKIRYKKEYKFKM